MLSGEETIIGLQYAALLPNVKFVGKFVLEYQPITGVANGLLKILGLGKFSSDFEISEAFVLSLGISFLHACIFCVSVWDFCAHRLGLGFSN